MKNKLTLEHLAPYLPYGLKGISKEENLGFEIVKGFYTYGKYDTISLITNVDDIDLILFKPILRPLSDLTKEIEVNGEKFVPMDFLYELFRETDLLYFEYSNVLKQPYNQVQKLFEWHFDVFGLIEKDLAIDINTL